MEVKLGYKQTEVGVIPEEWEVKRLGELFEVGSSKRVFQSEWQTHGVPFYRARELAVLGELGSVDNELFITREMFEVFKRTYGVPCVGDMLVTGVGTLGKVYVVRPDHEFYFKDGNIIWFKIAGGVSSEFLRQLYLTPVIKKQIGDNSAGTTVGTYTIGGAKKTVIPFPPPPEQRAIAAALSDVDGLLGGLDRLIAKKRDLKQAAMQQLLTGQTRLPGFHSEWEEATLGKIGKFKNGLNKDSSAFGHGSPFVNLMDVFGVNSISSASHLGLVASTKMDREAYDLRQGDVLFIRSSVKPSGVGLTAVIERDLTDTVYSGFLIRFRDEGALDNGFKKHCFYAETFRNKIIAASSVSANTNINQNALGALTVLLPPTKAEQTAIAEVLTEMDGELAVLEQRREKTRALKQAMMQELLTGRTRLV